MAFPKPLFCHLKYLKPSRIHRHPALSGTRRHLSFATPEEAAAERRLRKVRLGINPPLSSLRHLQPPPPPQQRAPPTPRNPNVAKLPEPASAVSGARLVLHNRILSLIRDDDLNEAVLLVRHSIYSNCRPTVFTCNAVLAALLGRSRHADLVALHRFVTQAGIAPNVVTHNLLLQAYCYRKRTDTALEHYRVILRDSPFTPSPTTYRILIKGLLNDSRLDDAVNLKDEMTAKAFCPTDPTVYNLLMSGFIENGNPDQALNLWEELKVKLGGGLIMDGVVYGNLMKAYFKKGMERDAMECYHGVVREGSKVRFKAVSYNSMLDALSKNEKFDEALRLFDRMMGEHDPPRGITMNLESFTVMVDGFCSNGRFDEAIAIFREMGDKKCSPDTFSYNNLIKHLGKEHMVAEAEELYREMGECGCDPDEATYVLLMEACFGVSRIDDATGYFKKMVEVELRPSTGAYNKVMGGLVNVGRVDEAKMFFDQMVEKESKPNVTSYEMLLQAFCEAGRLDDALKTFKDILMDEGVVSKPEMKELMEAMLRKDGREEELGKLFEEVEREKAEALARAAEEKARAEAHAREEVERTKAKAAAREAAIVRASAEAVEAVLGRISSASSEERKEESLGLGTNAVYEGVLEAVTSCSGSGEGTKAGVDTTNWGALEEVINESGSGEETKGGDKNGFEREATNMSALKEVRNNSCLSEETCQDGDAL